MKFRALFLALVVLIISCQKEPEVDLDTEPPIVVNDSITITSFSPDSVVAGDTIRIGGTGFDSSIVNITVAINGVPFQLVSVNDSLVVAVIPENATTGKVSVTVDGKTITSKEDLVVYQKPPDVVEKDIWVKKADYPGSLPDEGPEYFHSFSLNGKGYYLKHQQLWEYTPETNTWTQKSGPPTASTINSYGFCFTVADKAYIGLGAPGPGDSELSEFRQIWEYNATTGAWTRKKDFPGTPRVSSFGFSIGTAGYVGGGDTSNVNIIDDYVSDFWKYETTTDTWTRLKDFPGLRPIGLTGVNSKGNGFVIELGANSPTAPIADYKDIHVWKYNPLNDTWEKRAKIPTQAVYSGGGTSFVLDDKIYLAAGVMEANAQSLMQNFWMYDPADNTWTIKKDIGDGSPRLFSYGFAIDNKGYVGLGTGATADEVKKDFWQYNP